MKVELIIVSARPWEMQDENTGRKMRGTSLYTLGGVLDSNSGGVGLEHGKMSADVSVYPKLLNVPSNSWPYRCFVECIQKKSGGKMSLFVTDIYPPSPPKP